MTILHAWRFRRLGRPARSLAPAVDEGDAANSLQLGARNSARSQDGGRRLICQVDNGRFEATGDADGACAIGGGRGDAVVSDDGMYPTRKVVEDVSGGGRAGAAGAICAGRGDGDGGGLEEGCGDGVGRDAEGDRGEVV